MHDRHERVPRAWRRKNRYLADKQAERRAVIAKNRQPNTPVRGQQDAASRWLISCDKQPADSRRREEHGFGDEWFTAWSNALKPAIPPIPPQGQHAHVFDARIGQHAFEVGLPNDEHSGDTHGKEAETDQKLLAERPQP